MWYSGTPAGVPLSLFYGNGWRQFKKIHISKLDRKRVEKVEDVVTVGDMIWVKFMEIDEKGRWNLSRKDALIEIEAQQAAAKAAEQQ